MIRGFFNNSKDYIRTHPGLALISFVAIGALLYWHFVYRPEQIKAACVAAATYTEYRSFQNEIFKDLNHHYANIDEKVYGECLGRAGL